MNIAFRVDSSLEIGSGHVMRCLTLAKSLQKVANVQFICRNKPGNLIPRIEANGFIVSSLEEVQTVSKRNKRQEFDWLGVDQSRDADECTQLLSEKEFDWVVVDHYGINKVWHQQIRDHTKKLLVIDDLADREYSCDLLLDQNYYPGAKNRYTGLVSRECKLLLGPQYALLREEFANYSGKQETEKGSVDTLLVYFGGSDLGNNTLKALQGIQTSKCKDAKVNVIISPQSPYKQEILNFASAMENVNCFDFIENIAEVMRHSDLYIGSAGTTTWERCCTGLPSMVLAIAENQIKPMEAMQEAGLTFYLGDADGVSSADIADQLNDLLAKPQSLSSMRQKNLKLVDGQGVSRCASEILTS